MIEITTGDIPQAEAEALVNTVNFCTHLKGKASWFLPFNLGYNDGAGNPPSTRSLVLRDQAGPKTRQCEEGTPNSAHQAPKQQEPPLVKRFVIDGSYPEFQPRQAESNSDHGRRAEQIVQTELARCGSRALLFLVGSDNPTPDGESQNPQRELGSEKKGRQ